MKNASFPKTWPAALLLMAAIGPPPLAHAQAWLPEPGRGSLYLGYEYARAHWTLLPFDASGYVNGPYKGGPGKKIFEGEHYDQLVTADLDYGIRRWLATTMHFVWVSSRYIGSNAHKDRAGRILEADDGHYHGSLQDGEVALRSTVLRTPFIATPFVGYVFPLRRVYAARGHAATGHHLREVKFGTALARSLRPILPDAYGQLVYTYNLAERQFDHSIHRHSVDMELGYFVTSSLSLKGAASWVRTSGGISWYRQSAEFKRYTLHHDELANERSWRLAGGVGYALTPRYSLYALGFATVAGSSTHAMNGFATGIGWNFAAPWAP